jgi:ubiquitin carboxyl-terminal hydrolase 10
MFCLPFYDFLSQISKRAVHSFKSDTPLIDAMWVIYQKDMVRGANIGQDHVYA